MSGQFGMCGGMGARGESEYLHFLFGPVFTVATVSLFVVSTYTKGRTC